MSIKDKIKEIENASEDLLVPEHDSKVAETIGEKIHEVDGLGVAPQAVLERIILKVSRHGSARPFSENHPQTAGTISTGRISSVDIDSLRMDPHS